MAKRGLNLPKERTFTGPALVWKRLLALMADLLIINAIIFFPFKSIIQRTLPSFSSYQEAYSFIMVHQSYTRTLTIVVMIMSLFALLYFALLEYKIQQTPGKILFNLFIISDINKLTFWQCVIRSLFIIPVFPFFLLWVIDPLFILLTKNNQRLSEIISRTRTVETYIIR